jgi:SAM-dependent methyltransferase
LDPATKLAEPVRSTPWNENSKQTEYTEQRRRYWDDFAGSLDKWQGKRGYYQKRLAEFYTFLIPPGMRVLEVGCGQGDLLAALRPSYGVGIDLSGVMVERANARHAGKNLTFVQADAHEFNLGETFDYIVCSDLVNDLWDVQQVFEQIALHAHSSTRVVTNSYNRLWEQPRRVAEALGLAKPMLTQNWLTGSDVVNLLYLAGFEVIRSSPEILWPVRTPLLDGLLNRYAVKISPFKWFALTNFQVARLQPEPRTGPEPVVSVIVAARNEEGNVPAIFARVPQMGGGTELIFVEGNSKDDTYGAIEREMKLYPHMNVKLFKQPGKGKGDAVRVGFKEATGEVLMILDADLTVPPEDLPRFYDAWLSGKAEFVNGVRLIYPMEEKAMKFFNHIGNRFFSMAFTWLLSQSIKDTLCGTKVLSKRNYDMIAANRAYFGEIDPFGDFDLIFGAAKYNLKIVDLPVRYRERTYGDTNIQRWTHGMILLRMVMLAMRRIKFV